MDVPKCVLPDPTVAECDAIRLIADGSGIHLVMHSLQMECLCPVCGVCSTRVHSRYQRTLADLPWAGLPVRITLAVRRFFCDNEQCPRRIFVERLSSFVDAWARRTRRLAEVQREVAHVAGGSGGSRLCRAIGCPAGVDLLIRLVRCHTRQEETTFHVLGVDDWAIRKGQTYGTILVDHIEGRVIDLLPDRTPETLTEWLRAHPGVTLVTRDRAEAYANGIRAGAPDALQVADRWHLLKNLTDALTEVFQEHDHDLRQLRQAERAQESRENQPIPTPSTQLAIDSNEPTLADQRRTDRTHRARALRESGQTYRAIAAELGVHPKTVSRSLRRPEVWISHRFSRGSKLDGFRDYIVQRWNEGCHNAAQIYREIVPKGFEGRLTIVRAHFASLRIRAGIPARVRRPLGHPISHERVRRWPTPRSFAWLVTQPPALREPEDQRRLDFVKQNHQRLNATIEAAQAFADMVRQRQPDQLVDWIQNVMGSGLKTMQRFARGIQADLAAVQAALELPWSNGRTEGFINRLKCLKRQSYGRAKIDLLRQRLCAA